MFVGLVMLNKSALGIQNLEAKIGLKQLHVVIEIKTAFPAAEANYYYNSITICAVVWFAMLISSGYVRGTVLL